MTKSPAPARNTANARIHTITRRMSGAGSRRRDPGYQTDPSGSSTPYEGPTGTAGISAVTIVPEAVSRTGSALWRAAAPVPEAIAALIPLIDDVPSLATLTPSQ